MALTRAQKQAQVKDLTDKFKSAQSVMFAHYIGLTVAEVSELRAKLKEQDAQMQVAKKTLLKLAAKEAGMPEIDADVITGPVSCIFSTTDPLSGAQIAFKFGKSHNQVQILGGIFDGKILTKNEAIELAKKFSSHKSPAFVNGILDAVARNMSFINDSDSPYHPDESRDKNKKNGN